MLEVMYKASFEILRWQDTNGTADEPAPKRRCTRSSKSPTGSSSAEPSGRPQVVLTLPDAAHEPAALAVLASLYATKPLPELLSELSQEQLLQAAMLAGMWQVPDVSTAAVDALTAAQKAGTLSDTVLHQFLQLQAVPAFLLPLLGPVADACMQHSDAAIKAGAKGLLLSVLGDLEEVLADETLKQQLLKLPLPVVELLLSSGDLKVASEDTVLAAVRMYIIDSPLASNRQQARQALGPLIRCQHLSIFWLSACVLTERALNQLFAPYSQQLKKLLMMKLAGGAVNQPTQQQLAEHMEGAPASWLLGKRAFRKSAACSLCGHSGSVTFARWLSAAWRQRVTRPWCAPTHPPHWVVLPARWSWRPTG